MESQVHSHTCVCVCMYEYVCACMCVRACVYASVQKRISIDFFIHSSYFLRQGHSQNL